LISLTDSSLKEIKGVGEKYLKILNRYRYHTVADLLIHFPEYYIDASETDNRITEGEEKVYTIRVRRSGLYRNYRRRLSVINISGSVGDTPAEAAIFNQPYLFDKVRSSEILKIYGKAKMKGNLVRFENPKLLKEEEGVIPMYRNIGSLTGGKIRKLIENIFAHEAERDDLLPGYLLERYGYEPLWESLEKIHFPASPDPDTEALRERFIYTEFLFFQLEIAAIRQKSGKIGRERVYSIPETGSLIKDRISFELTPDQHQSVEEILSDLKGKFTMQRLLMGDVGSGKTVISFIFLMAAVKSGHQGAFLAPTEILITQHYQNAQTFFHGIRIDLITGSTPAAERKKKTASLKNGDTQILFGTHAIIHEKIVFQDLSAIVIDEQHRFGVAQRAALFYKGIKADLMVTTATPIPRTLLLSLYRDLDVSEIKSMPSGRKPIETRILNPEIREQFYHEIERRAAEGEKAFVVLPLIARSSRFRELRSLEGELPFYQKIFGSGGFRVISGKSGPGERQAAIREFADGETRVLISTTVIEVGIDIPDATIMVIEDADKYGLSQLHQLRGRVGRGNRQSFCYLFPSAGITSPGKERLKVMKENSSGFEIAEKDLGMRGGGNIAGTEQSGYLDFHIADIKEYPDLFFRAGRDAAELIQNESGQNGHIRNRLKRIEEDLKKISFS